MVVRSMFFRHAFLPFRDDWVVCEGAPTAEVAFLAVRVGAMMGVLRSENRERDDC